MFLQSHSHPLLTFLALPALDPELSMFYMFPKKKKEKS